VPIWIDRSVRIAHAKSMIIDGKVTLTGSMNWTGGAAYNSENLNLVASPTIAAAYAGNWHQRLALSLPCGAAKRLVQERRYGRFQIGITDDMRTEQRDRLEAGGFLRQPRNAPLKAYSGDVITRSDWAWTSS
jgi:phosphatidylserine/phosphatidylglycerophosphate/cardiolipin synthase-like enzyme